MTYTSPVVDGYTTTQNPSTTVTWSVEYPTGPVQDITYGLMTAFPWAGGTVTFDNSVIVVDQQLNIFFQSTVTTGAQTWDIELQVWHNIPSS